MERKVFSVFDTVAQVYGYPFVFLHEGEAIRWLDDIVNDERSNISKHPADYKLYRIGKYNDVSGELIPCKSEFVCNAIDFVKMEIGKEQKNDKGRK